MFSSNKRKIAIFLFLFACIAVNIAAIKPAVDGDFKNLQILPKDISKDSLDVIMDSFKAALGVKCNFCHIRDAKDPSHFDFASDDRTEKNITRLMMTMTHEVNAKYFNFENSSRADTIHIVSCITCHRGEPRPGESNEEDKKDFN